MFGLGVTYNNSFYNDRRRPHLVQIMRQGRTDCSFHSEVVWIAWIARTQKVSQASAECNPQPKSASSKRVMSKLKGSVSSSGFAARCFLQVPKKNSSKGTSFPPWLGHTPKDGTSREAILNGQTANPECEKY